MDDEIIAALESSAPVKGDRGNPSDPRTASDADIRLWARGLLRFINELDGNITVDEIRRAIEDY